MRRLGFALLVLGLVVVGVDDGVSQTKRKTAVQPTQTGVKTVPADRTCPSELGAGVTTKRVFCDVLTGRDPVEGVLVRIPPHRGTATLLFDLHNRHTYSEDEVKSRRGYRRYTATISVVAMDGSSLGRAVVQSEFRTAADLVDRVGGGAGPTGVKAVAPTGSEPIVITIPEDVNQVSVLGEKLTMERIDGTATYTQPDRPIADISNVTIEYKPRPPARSSKPKR